MDRTEGRQLAYDTLVALPHAFAKGFMSEPETFGSYNPVFVVHSKSLAIGFDTRDDTVLPTEFYVSIYVARPRDASEADKDAIEAQIDALTKASMRALWAAIDARELTIGPSEMGYPPRSLDSMTYRVERIPIRYVDDTEE